MRPLRSLLFVPGHKASWADKALASGADGLILDLEDAVPNAEKEGARCTVRESLARLRRQSTVALYVRPNAWETGMAGFDLDAVVCAELDGLFLPKVYTVEDVLRFDTLLAYFEQREGLPVGRIELVVCLETAASYYRAYELARACPRVACLAAPPGKGADVQRELGYQWTEENLETLYYRSHAVLAARAAGHAYILGGLWQDIRDLEGLRREATRNRQLGFTGEVVIHPSHVPVVNEIYSPTAEELAYYRGLVQAFEAAERAGSGAVNYEGAHIDYAHVKTARQVLELARALGLDAAGSEADAARDAGSEA
ncbi:MAG: HpcH/HpaI aldolase/citrate lyase family protein [Clostridia bacterium]|nr:HpcH/HpaI aldolase/citrate lyase family protein [Clostridia bacterium]